MEKIECSVCNSATVSRRIYRKKKYMYIHRTCIHSILFYTQNSCEQCWRNAFQFRYIHKYKICRDVYIAAYVNIIVFSSMYSKSSGKRAAVECTQHIYTHTYIHMYMHQLNRMQYKSSSQSACVNATGSENMV